jgi:hypothetical protein
MVHRVLPACGGLRCVLANYHSPLTNVYCYSMVYIDKHDVYTITPTFHSSAAARHTRLAAARDAEAPSPFSSARPFCDIGNTTACAARAGSTPGGVFSTQVDLHASIVGRPRSRRRILACRTVL